MLSEDTDTDKISRSVEELVGEVQGYVPGYRLKQEVQFERFGYCTLDKKEDMSFIFLSK